MRVGVVERHFRSGALESHGERVGAGLPVEYRRWWSGGDLDPLCRHGGECGADEPHQHRDRADEQNRAIAPGTVTHVGSLHIDNSTRNRLGLRSPELISWVHNSRPNENASLRELAAPGDRSLSQSLAD